MKSAPLSAATSTSCPSSRSASKNSPPTRPPERSMVVSPAQCSVSTEEGGAAALGYAGYLKSSQCAQDERCHFAVAHHTRMRRVASSTPTLQLHSPPSSKAEPVMTAIDRRQR